MGWIDGGLAVVVMWAAWGIESADYDDPQHEDQP